MTTNKDNNADFSAIPFFNLLEKDNQDDLKELFKDGKIMPQDDNLQKLIIQNKNHILEITRLNLDDSYIPYKTSDIFKHYKENNALAIIKENNFLQNHHFLTNYNNVVYDVFGAVAGNEPDDYIWDLGNNEPICYIDTLFSFKLDGKVILIRNYNADLKYYLKEALNQNEDYCGFINKDCQLFNNGNDAFIKMFKNVNDDIFNNFFNLFNLYKEQLANANNTNDWMAYYYFYLFLQDEPNNILANQLKNLAKNGFKVAIKTDFVKLYNDKENIYKAYFNVILDNKILASVPFSYDFKEKPSHNCALKDEIITLNKEFENTLKEISKYLQIPIFVQIKKLMKLFNQNQNNISNHLIDNSKQVYLCSSLSINHGIFKMNNSTTNLLSKDLLVWKYENDALFFSFINGYSLCVWLAKNKKIEDLVLNYTINNAKNFVKLNYILKNYKLESNIRTKNNEVIYLHTDLTNNASIDKTLTDFYNQWENQIFLKEIVAKKISK